MINAALAIWIGFEALRRKCFRLLPVSMLVLLYEAADAGWFRVLEVISIGSLIKKLILFVLVLFVFLAWRKGQVKISAMIACVLALASRLSWSPVFDRYLEAAQQPDADYVGLIAQGAAVKMIFGAVTDALLLLMLVLILLAVRKLPLAEKKQANC